MIKKELEEQLMRFSHLGVAHSKNGALLIGKAPHIAEFAWLNVMYPCATETEICDLEKRLGSAIPEVYKDFLMNVSNGFDIMNCTLALHGFRASYNRVPAVSMMKSDSFYCRVFGLYLAYQPWVEDGRTLSYNNLCCGVEFGYEDD